MTEWIKADEWDSGSQADVVALTYNGETVQLGWWPTQSGDVTGWWHEPDDGRGAIEPPVTHVLIFPDPPKEYGPPETVEEGWLRMARAADLERARRPAE
jgi:hypothetical protein